MDAVTCAERRFGELCRKRPGPNVAGQLSELPEAIYTPVGVSDIRLHPEMPAGTSTPWAWVQFEVKWRDWEACQSSWQPLKSVVHIPDLRPTAKR